MMNSKPMTDEIRKIKETDVALNNIPIIVNGENKRSVAVFQDITRIQPLEKRIRIELTNKGFVTKYTFDTIIRKSSLMEKTIETARTMANFYPNDAHKACCKIDEIKSVRKLLLKVKI